MIKRIDRFSINGNSPRRKVRKISRYLLKPVALDMMVCCTVFIQLRKSVTKYIHRMHHRKITRCCLRSRTIRTEGRGFHFQSRNTLPARLETDLSFTLNPLAQRSLLYHIYCTRFLLGARVLLKLPELAGIFAFFKHFTRNRTSHCRRSDNTLGDALLLFVVVVFLHLIFSILISILISHCCHSGWADKKKQKIQH